MLQSYSGVEVQEFFDLSLDFLVVTDLQFKIIKLNPALLKFSGYEPQELAGKSAFDFVHPDDKDRLLGALQNSLSKGLNQVRFEVRFRAKDGAYKWIEWSSKPILEKNLVYNIGRDITERKNDAAELYKSQQDMKNLLAFNQEVIASAGEGIIVYDRDMRYLAWNRFMQDLTGMKIGDVLGKSAIELFPHLKEQGIDKLISRALNGETVVSPDTLYRDPRTGKPRWVIGTYVPHRNVDGDILGVVGLIQDITERKRVEAMISESERNFRSIFDNANDGLLIIDPANRRLIASNASFQRMLGYSEDEIKAMSVDDLHPVEVLPFVLQQLEKIARGETPMVKEVPVKRKDGSIFYAEITSSPIASKEATRIVGFFRDVTQRIKTEKDLKDKLDEIERHYKLMLGREKRVIELKNEIDDLLKALGKPPRYNI